jgi:adenine-specific DNA-methyltransferase
VLQGYKRYRVSSTRPSAKPMNIEFVLVTDTMSKARVAAEEIVQHIRQAERHIVSSHLESNDESALRLELF